MGTPNIVPTPTPMLAQGIFRLRRLGRASTEQVSFSPVRLCQSERSSASAGSATVSWGILLTACYEANVEALDHRKSVPSSLSKDGRVPPSRKATETRPRLAVVPNVWLADPGSPCAAPVVHPGNGKTA